jgi:hypothetical protein
VTRRTTAPWIPVGIVLLLLLTGVPLALSEVPTTGAPSAGHLARPPAIAGRPDLGGPVIPRAHRGLQVNPYSYYSTEPAPMGIADFGVDPATGNGYTYNTTEFVGTLGISSLTVLNANNTGSIDQMSIQLNVVLVINGSGGTFTYWIQDVAFLNTTTNMVQFINNVWNMSSSGASTSCTDITGNGTGCYGWYYTYASSFLPGNDISLTYPASIGLRVISSISAGLPSVAFEYNDTGSWVTYDNIVVSFASGYSSQGFVVDGNSYNPFGLFNDAELILGGPGGGSQTAAVTSNLSLTLGYWNGHNVQPITNAYNFGSDTAEGISNIVDRGQYWPVNGTLYGAATNGSSHGLATLWDRSYAALLNVSSPLTSGYLVLNGTTVASFVGSDANVTVAPGRYNVELETTAGSLYANKSVVVPRGAYVPVVFGAAGSYSVTVKETGLPTGTSWSVTIGTNLYRSSGTVINLLEFNGTYPFHVTPIAGWAASPWSGNFSVFGRAAVVNIAWSRVTYPVTFTETGLPGGSQWQVILGGTGVNGKTASLQVDEPNGTYSFTVSGPTGYEATPGTGSVSVTAAARSIAISWSVAKFPLTLTEQGLPAETSWTVVVAGSEHFTSTASLNILLPNGSYTYQVGLIAGFAASDPSGPVEIAGAPVLILLNFTPFESRVTFTETGLPAGTNWSVSAGGLTATGTSTALVLDLVNGSYDAKVTDHAPYTETGSVLTVQVRGAPLGVPVPFAPLPGWLDGTLTPAGATLVVNGTGVALTPSGAFNVTLPPGSYTLTAELTGYETITETITIGPGAGTPVTLALTIISSGGHTKNGTTPIHLSSNGGLSTWDLEVGLVIVVAAVAVAAVAGLMRRRSAPPSTEPAEAPPVD